MSKWFLLFVFTFITGNILFAQSKLEIKGTGSHLFIDHIVAPKESFYSIGRMYNVNPKELAAFNHLKLEIGLNIGQGLKIPLDKNNFTQAAGTKNGTFIPLYHIVAPGETLYRLGVNYNKVSLASLKAWNHLPSDALTVGHPMIVGYLKVENGSALALGGTNRVTETTTTPPQEEKPAGINQQSVQEAAKPAVPAEETKSPAQEQATVSAPANTRADLTGGYFKNLYEGQTAGKPVVETGGSAGVFKSTSGFQDKKYYCFSNDAAAGTVLKVTDKASGKSIYAKVLDAIPDIKQNSGLSIIISNASAQELGIGENPFECLISYAK